MDYEVIAERWFELLERIEEEKYIDDDLLEESVEMSEELGQGFEEE